MIRFTAVDVAHRLNQPEPTREQQRVIEAPLEPQLVIAGAGSGKTATMAARVVYLIANELIWPEQILGLTFTRKAAAELADRVRRSITGMARTRQASAEIDLTEQPHISTYNSYAAGIVRDHALRIGIDPDATLIGEAGQFQLASEIVHGWTGDLDISAAPSTTVKAVISLAGELAEHGLTPTQARAYLEGLARALTDKEVAKRAKKPAADIAKLITSLQHREQVLTLVETYQQLKYDRNLIDFGDQVRRAATIASTVPAVGAAERDHYRVVLLDEYQDTSIAQVQLLAALFATGDPGHPVTAVGDPNQAIYGWRGAAAGTLTDFPSTFPRSNGADAAIVSLSTAWRNADTILTVANQVAAPLRAEQSQLVGLMPSLQPRPQVPPGAVHARYPETSAEEATTVVDFLRDLGWHDGREANSDEPAPSSPTAAVLCRKRSSFPAMIAALEEAGISYQLGRRDGLLDTPEVADLWAGLTVAHDPSRGDALMRLLTGPAVGVGSADLMALSQWSKSVTVDTSQQQNQQPQRREEAETASIVEAIDRLPPPQWRSPDGLQLSENARRRLAELAEQLRLIRSLTYLPLPELVLATERLLGLDIEVIAQAHGGGYARTNLDRFLGVAAEFHQTDRADLTGFLAWLEVAYEHENGLNTGEEEPDPNAVQLMTIHAAKGLEWDAVVVAGLNDGDFPTINENSEGNRVSSGWCTSMGSLPYELRGDGDHLPSFDHEQAHTHADMKQVWEDFRHAEGQRLLQEERRLAYVAVTRARDHLLLIGSFWGTRTKVNRPSIFLTEACRAGAQTPQTWPEQSQYEQHPTADQVTEAIWPPAQSTLGYWQELFAHPDGTDPLIDHWREEAQLLLAERDETRVDQHQPPAHLSASAVVSLAQDPDAFERNRRRPIPSEPSVHARRGTTFHSWVERFYGASTLLDWEGLPGADDQTAPEQEDMAELIEAFQASTWAAREPIQVESDLQTPVAGVMVRCRIDAIFRDDDGCDHVVDWKTGGPPRNPQARAARDLQLVLYRLAWARAQDRPLDQVRASFHYVQENLTVAGADLDEQAVAGVLAQLHSDPAGAPARPEHPAT